MMWITTKMSRGRDFETHVVLYAFYCARMEDDIL